jgi:predicted dehydrogenase
MTNDLRIGLLGCGPIAQFAHLPALTKARGVELVALCDAAGDLLQKMGARVGVDTLYTDSEKLFGDSSIESVLIAVSDPFHHALVLQALEAGKHVLVEKPLAETSTQCEEIAAKVESTGLKLQVGSMKRHDPGIAFAKEFIRERMGDLVSISGYYWDSSFRPELQETLLPPVISADGIKRPEADPKADVQSYSLVTHGAHLFDNLRFLGGPIAAVRANYVLKGVQHCWQGLVEYENGAHGHFDLTVKIHADWAEGYVVQGKGGSVEIETFIPFYYRPSQVRAFDKRNEQWHTPLGPHSNPYKNQLEAFARSIRNNVPTVPDVYEGWAAVRMLEAVEEAARTGERVRLEPQ